MDVYAEQNPGNTNTRQALALRNKIARDLFQNEPVEVRQRFEAESDAKHAAQVEQYQDALTGEPSANAPDQEE